MESTRMPRETAIIMLEVPVAGRRVSYSAVLIYIKGGCTKGQKHLAKSSLLMLLD